MPWWADKSMAYLNHTTIYYADTHKHTHVLRKRGVGSRRRRRREGGIKGRRGVEEVEVKKGRGRKAGRTD